MQWPFKAKSPCASKREGDVLVTPSRRWGRKATLVLLLLVISMWCWQKASNPASFPIRDVKIIDQQSHINHEVIRQTISPYLHNGMLGLNTADLKNTLLQIPWVYQVTLSRVWPDKLIVTFTEQIPIAYWNNQQLLNSHLAPFNSEGVIPDQSLPVLSGPDNQQNLVWQNYQAMNAELEPVNLKMSKLTLSSRGGWVGQLNNDIILIFGREDVLNHLDHFVQVYPKIFTGNTKNVDYVDLRYNNGLAVKWKNNSANNPAPP
jgi:cell division protein FtsQ